MAFYRTVLVAGLTLFGEASAGHAQTGVDTMFVLDGSGSMWGEIDQSTKIEIARDTLSSVLSELDANQTIGMIAYGHRQKGNCADIEDIVPLGPASQSVPAMISAANAIVPRGKTPITDAVRRAAEKLKYTENEATVVLLTDGIETCDADPCALAQELERLGVGFTAHVVGFGLSDEEGRQVQCLADTTGGLYFSAQTADELGDALRRTVQAETQPEPAPEPVDAQATKRRVVFVFRDTPEGEQIGARQLTGGLEGADGASLEDAGFEFAFPEASGLSATAQLEPGSYVGKFRREGGTSGGYDVAYAFDVPEGDGEHRIEASFSGALKVNLFINPNLPYSAGDPLPRATSGSAPRIHLHVFAMTDGDEAPASEPVAEGRPGLQEFPLAAGTYLVRGVLDRTTAAEMTVDVVAGTVTELDFSFDATRVYVDARDVDGAPVARQTTYWYDKVPSGRNYWVSGGGVSDGQVQPFYLPTGDWVVNVGGEGKGKRRSEVVVSVPGDFADVRVQIGESLTLDEDDKAYLGSPAYAGCEAMIKVVYNGCLVRPLESSSAAPETTEPEEIETAAKSEPEEPAQEVVQAPKEAPEPPQQAEASEPSTFAGLEGLTGEAMIFLADRGEDRFHIVYDPDVLQSATLVLEDGWCASASCKGARLVFPYQDIMQIRTAGYLTWTINDQGYLFQFLKDGDARSVLISGHGGRDVAFTFEKVVALGQAPDQEGQSSDAPQPETLVGVFSLHEDADVDDLLSGIKPLLGCQTEPVVFFPDSRVEVKSFVGMDVDLPYATTASGQCKTQDGLFACESLQNEPLPDPLSAFTAELVQDDHLKLCDSTGETCQIATACFYQGSSLLALTPLPKGGTLFKVLLQRQDGQDPGFGYDASNAILLQ